MLQVNPELTKIHLEEVDLKGYSIIESVITPDECKKISDKLDKFEEEQQKEFGFERLQKFGELGIIRNLLEKDDYFINTILNQIVLSVINSILGNKRILHLQNGLVLEPKIPQKYISKLHRDIPFLNYVGVPICVNAFWMIDNFTKENGATWILPYSHKMFEIPSDQFIEKNAIQLEGKKGSVIIFDSRLLHKAGYNDTGDRRRAINHMYTKSFIKQQLDFPKLVSGRYDLESETSQILGFWSVPPKSVHEYRSDPDKRTYRSGQH